MRHGGDLTQAAERYGTDAAGWLDLSTGINPHAWPVPQALRQADWTRLPSEADLAALLAAARRAYAVPPTAGIVAAAGTQALIQWLPRLAAPGPVAIVGPTYGEHAASWRAAGFDAREVASLKEAAGAHHAVIVTPNNPDGRVASRADLLAAAAHCAASGGWLVVDESFADVDPGCSLVPALSDLPAIVLRSFGKFYGLAGLRLGFAVAPPALAAGLERAMGPWAVSAPALAVGTAALADTGWAASMRGQLARESAALDTVLAAAGLAVIGGTGLYRLARHPGAADLHAALAARHIWTRRFDWAPDLLRFGLPPDGAGLDRLAAALALAR
jgi:cobalamin biosynthetic protein CobC